MRVIFLALAVFSTLFAAGATFAKLGVPGVENPQGVSLKKESLRRGHGMFYMGRSHYGGGIRGHK